MNIRELDEESRRTGVWPPRRIILRVEREAGDVDEPDAEPGVSVGLVDLAGPPRATVRPAPRPAPAPALAPEVLAPGQIAPRPPLSRPPAPGSVVRRHGRIVAAPRPATAEADEDAEFDKWLANPLALADPDPGFQPPPVWLPDDRRVRAERRHRRITRSARKQVLGTGAATTIAAAGCCAALALVLSQTEVVGGSTGVPSIGLFGTRPTAPPPDAVVAEPESKPKPNARRARTRSAKAPRSAPRAVSPPSRANRDAGTPAQGSATPPAQAPTRPAVVPPPPPPPPPPASSRSRTPAPPKPAAPAPKATPKAPAPRPVPAPPAGNGPSTGTPSLGGDTEPRL